MRLRRARVAPGVRLVALEVQRAPRLDRVLLPGHGELEHAAGDVDEFLARVLHRLAPAAGAGIHAGPRAGQQEPAVRAGDAVQLDALVRGVHRAVLAGRGEHGHVVLADVLLHEVGDRPAEGAGQLQQRGDGRDHATLLDLVDRGGRDVGSLAQLLQGQAHSLAVAEHLQADGPDDALYLSGAVGVGAGARLSVQARRALRPRDSVHLASARFTGRPSLDVHAQSRQYSVRLITDTKRRVPFSMRRDY